MFLHVENKEDQLSNPERDCVHDNLNPDCDLNMNKNTSSPTVIEDKE